MASRSRTHYIGVTEIYTNASST